MSSQNDIYDRAIASILAYQEANLRSSMPICSSRTESPIEGAFYLALAAAVNDSGYGEDIEISLQHQFGEYRVDFYVELHGQKLIIECDGHAFHDRTKVQASRDRARDRWLTSQGFRVIRFTGSDIWKDAFSCAKQATDILEALYHAHDHAIFRATEGGDD